MKKVIEPIINIGVSDKLSTQERRKLRSFNTILVYMSLALFSTLSTNLLEWSWRLFDTILYGLGFLAMGIGFLLNHYEKYELSKYFLFVASTLIMVMITVLSGHVYITSIVNMIFLGILFTFFENRKAIIGLAIYQLILVIACVFIIKNIDYPFDNNYFSPVTRSIIYTVTFCVLFAIGQYATQRLNSINAYNRQLIRDLKKQNREIEQAYKDMEQFAYVISHDMKAPLRSINSFAKLMKRDVAKGKTKNLEEYASFVYDNGTKLGQMIDDVLLYSKLGAASNADAQCVDLNDVVHQVQANLTKAYPNHKIQATDLRKVKGNRTQVLMLFQNLIENGIKYNTSSQPTVQISQVQNVENQIVEIRDNGIGIAPKHHQKIFELFARLHSEQEFEGTGVGLANCKRIVENHLKGQIALKSQEGNGTTFQVILPNLKYNGA